MDVCLVIPPYTTEFGDPCEARAPLVQERIKEAPLGILAVAAVTRDHGHHVRVVDLNTTYYDYFDSNQADDDFCEFAAGRLSEIPADVIGFGSICSSYPLILRIAEALRRRCPSTVIAAGGPQATVVAEASIRHFPSLDMVVRGEADETFPALLECLRAGRTPASIPGITFRDGMKIRRNPNAPPVHDLDALPLPAYDLFESLSVRPGLSIEAGRGCPFACTFCSTNDFFRRRFRLKSPATLIAQMTYLEQTYGARAFDFVHDMFTVDRKRVVDICEALIASGRRFQWSCSARSDCVDEQLLELMARAGCRGIFYGIETGSPRMQKLIEKDLDIGRSHIIIEKSVDLDIPTTVSVIAGFPEEERADLEQTVDFVYRSARHDLVSPQVHLMAPLAETPVHARYRHQLVLDDVYSDMSHQGWYQHPDDRALIAAYPDIFPNFYGLPARLDRPYVRELCRFIYYSLAFHRWLVIGTQAWFGPLAFFDEWLEWRRRVTGNTDSSPRYYASNDFLREFPTFVNEVYSGKTKKEQCLRVLAEYETRKLEASAWLQPPDRREHKDETLTITQSTVLHRARDVAVIEVAGDVPAIIDSLRQRTEPPEPDGLRRTMSVRISNDQVRATVESDFAGSLLRVFENPCAVEEARSRFCGDKVEMDGMPAGGVFGYTLKRLLEREMLSVSAAAAGD